MAGEWDIRCDRLVVAQGRRQSPASEALRINGEVYRLDERGYMVTGWASQAVSGSTHGTWCLWASGQGTGGTWYYSGSLRRARDAHGWMELDGAVRLDATGDSYYEGGRVRYYLQPRRWRRAGYEAHPGTT